MSTAGRSFCGACASGSDNDINRFVVGRGAFPAPKTRGFARGAARAGVVGGAEPGKKSYAPYVIAYIVVLVVVIVAVVAYRRHRKNSSKSSFWTEYAQEEPTRSYTAYTGTIPEGEWGNLPWALAMEGPDDSPVDRVGPPYTYLDL